MEVFFKITTWEKVKVSSNIESLILEGIKKGIITSSKDILELDKFADSFGVLEEVQKDKQLSLNDNNGLSTIRVLSNNKIIFENGN